MRSSKAADGLQAGEGIERVAALMIRPPPISSVASVRALMLAFSPSTAWASSGVTVTREVARHINRLTRITGNGFLASWIRLVISSNGSYHRSLAASDEYEH